MSYKSLVNTSGDLGNGNASNIGSIEQTYEELMQGSVPCPTCRGTGRIPSEQENELVALIPVRDQRLKPSRTKLWIALTVAIVLVIAGLFLFFFIPRNVQLSSTLPTIVPDHSSVNVADHTVFLQIQVQYNLTNANFFSVEVNNFKVSAYFNMKVIQEVTNASVVLVPLRSADQLTVFMNLTFNNEEGYIAEYCQWRKFWQPYIYVRFVAYATFTLLGQSEQSVLETFQHVVCLGPPPTTPPPTTTLTTAPTTTTLPPISTAILSSATNLKIKSQV